MERYKGSFDYYDEKIKMANGNTGESTAYGSKKSRLMRYFTSSRLPVLDYDDFESDSLLDVGCGPAHYVNWLDKNQHRTQAGLPVLYYGIEPQPRMFELIHTMEITKAVRTSFRNIDVFEVTGKYDWLIANCIFSAAFTEDVQENFDIFEETVKKMWDVCDKGMCFDVTVGALNGIDKEDLPGFNELVFSPVWIEERIRSYGCKRYIIDCSTSTRYMTVYMYKRPQIYDRIQAEDIE